MPCVKFVQSSDCEGRMNKVQRSDKHSDQLTQTSWDIELDAHLWLGWRQVFPLPVQRSPPCFFIFILCLLVNEWEMFGDMKFRILQTISGGVPHL